MIRTKLLVILAATSLALAGCEDVNININITGTGATEDKIGLANPWEYDLTAEEVKERTGCEFIVPEGAYDVVFGINNIDGLAEMNFTMDDVRYGARMKVAEDYEDISGLFYEWDAEGVDEVGNVMADVRLYTPENVCNVIWYDNGMMYSLFTNGADKEGTAAVKMANLVFAGGGSRSLDNEDADNKLTDISLGTTGFIISIPSDYYNGEVTKEERKDDQIAYYRSDDHLMDFDVYQFGKEGMTLREYAESEAEEYKADKVEEVMYNGVSMMLYYSQEEYDGKLYRVSNYIFENDTDFVELSFWLDGDDAEDIVQQILFSIYMDPEDSDDGVMHAFGSDISSDEAVITEKNGITVTDMELTINTPTTCYFDFTLNNPDGKEFTFDKTKIRLENYDGTEIDPFGDDKTPIEIEAYSRVERHSYTMDRGNLKNGDEVSVYYDAKYVTSLFVGGGPKNS